MPWSYFLDQVYKGIFQIFAFIPPDKLDMNYGVEYYVVMIGIWLVIFFSIWLVLFLVYKICSIIGN
ncbi:hypothetical protein [Spiroplasma melliferum]|uniref:Membrane protein n=2 Tax=Spiroplasma melliferum TaxID=2134 RepID=A0AAI9T3J1_SPIME|nr:hypothetical protein [Spiroplasma melliferum]KAI92763.1 membrane protein [Spiroplasma melliferum KC3]QCO24392.1 Spiroplasmavirus-related protein [Spiroplasma melliferum]